MCNMGEFTRSDNWFESLRSIQTSCRSGKDLRECRIVKVLMPDREGKECHEERKRKSYR